MDRRECTGRCLDIETTVAGSAGLIIAQHKHAPYQHVLNILYRPIPKTQPSKAHYGFAVGYDDIVRTLMIAVTGSDVMCTVKYPQHTFFPLTPKYPFSIYQPLSRAGIPTERSIGHRHLHSIWHSPTSTEATPVPGSFRQRLHQPPTQALQPKPNIRNHRILP